MADFEGKQKWMASRRNMPTDAGSDELARLAPAIRAHSFFSARVANGHVLDKLREISDSYTRGETDIATARLRLKQWLDRNGAGKIEEPGSREDARMSNLWSTARLNLILRQNARMAYAAGEWEQGQSEDSRRMFPYWRYVASTSESPRSSHRQYAGKIFRKDDPIWHRIFPPWDFNCKCSVEEVAADEVEDDKVEPLTNEDKLPAIADSGFAFDPAEALRVYDPELIHSEELRENTVRDLMDMGCIQREDGKLEMPIGAKAEAERRLKQFPGVQEVDFDGWDDDEGIKAVADCIERLGNEYDVPPPVTRLRVEHLKDPKAKAGDSGIICGYTFRSTHPAGEYTDGETIDGQVSLNIDYLKLIPELRKREKYGVKGMEYSDASTYLVFGQEAECSATHEFGHRIISQFLKRGEIEDVHAYIDLVYERHKRGWMTAYGVRDVSNEISKYAKSSWEEFWSESFSMYINGGKDRMPPDVRAMVGNVLSCIRKEKPVPTARLKEVAKLYRKEYKVLDQKGLGIDDFGKPHPVIVDMNGNAIRHNEIPRISGDLPDYPREKAEDHLKRVKDKMSDRTDKEKEEDRQKCKDDIEKLRPGLAAKAQFVYDNRLDATDRDVIHAYTMRELYGINQKIFRMYRENNLEPDKVHPLSDYLDDRDRYETERRLRVLDKLPKFKGTVYRAMDLQTADALEDFLARWKNGESPLTGFISTSYVMGPCEKRLKNATVKVILIVHDSENGSYLGHLSSTPWDEEVLYGCNQKFRLMSEDEFGSDPIVVKDGIVYINIKEN